MYFTSQFPTVDIPANKSLPDFVFSRVNKHPNKPYMIESTNGTVVTFEQARKLTNNLAKNLYHQYEFKKGHVFAILLPNVPLYPIIFLGVATCGGASSTINPLYTAEEIHKQLKASGARFIITCKEHLDKTSSAVVNTSVENIFLIDGHANNTLHADALLKEPSNKASLDILIDPQHDLVSIPFSSGTTGVNKGCMISHYNIISNLCQLEPYGHVTETEVIAGFLPYFHIYGQIIIMLFALYMGATIINITRFEFVEFLRLVDKYHISHANVVPPVMILLSKDPAVEKYNLSSLKRLFSGAAPLSSEVTNLVKSRLNGVDIVQAYGMTELATAVTCSRSYHGKNGSAGVLMPNVQMKIVDVHNGTTLLGSNKEGELVFKTPSAMKGYLNNKQATDETIKDGWLHTGDIGYIDHEGHVFVVDRLKELIKYKGFQVPPAELEGLLLKHEAVADCAVIGIPDDSAGELPKAFIVRKFGYEHVTDHEIMEYVAKHVNPQKRVRIVEFTNIIPKSATGKILRRMLRQPRSKL